MGLLYLYLYQFFPELEMFPTQLCEEAVDTNVKCMGVIDKLNYGNKKVDYNHIVILIATTPSCEVALNNRNKHVNSDVREVR
jgi:hypothetical protein